MVLCCVCCVNTAVNFFRYVMTKLSVHLHDLHNLRYTTSSAVRVAVSNSCLIVPCHQRRTLSTERGCSRSFFVRCLFFIAYFLSRHMHSPSRSTRKTSLQIYPERARQSNVKNRFEIGDYLEEIDAILLEVDL